ARLRSTAGTEKRELLPAAPAVPLPEPPVRLDSLRALRRRFESKARSVVRATARYVLSRDPHDETSLWRTRPRDHARSPMGHRMCPRRERGRRLLLLGRDDRGVLPALVRRATAAAGERRVPRDAERSRAR